MCKKLILILLVALMSAQSLALNGDRFQPPRTTSSVIALKQFAKDKDIEHAVEYHDFAIDNEKEIVVMMVNSGSGLLNIDAYVYGCGPGICYMIAMRNGGAAILIPEMARDMSELILKSESGKVYLRVPFSECL